MLGPIVVSRQTPDEGGVVRAVRVRLDPLDLALAELRVVLRSRLFGALGVTRYKRTGKKSKKFTLMTSY